jgi:tyrosinase
VPDGGFRKLHLSYPSPHTLRRNFTLRPFDIPFVVFEYLNPSLEANRTFLASAVKKILEIPDYKVFQKRIEAVGEKQTRLLSEF